MPPSRDSDSVSPGAHVSPLVQPLHRTTTSAPAIAISATFTAEALQPTLAFWLGELKLDFQIRFAPYNQVFLQLLDPAGLFAGNPSGLNVVLVRLEDWGRFRDALSLADLEQNVRNLESALRSA